MSIIIRSRYIQFGYIADVLFITLPIALRRYISIVQYRECVTDQVMQTMKQRG